MSHEDLPRGSFCLKGHIDVPAERLAMVRDALVLHIRLTREEPDCIFFDVDPCPEVKGRYLVSEAFVNEAAFKHHQDRAGNSFWAKASEGIAREYEIWVVGD